MLPARSTHVLIKKAHRAYLSMILCPLNDKEGTSRVLRIASSVVFMCFLVTMLVFIMHDPHSSAPRISIHSNSEVGSAVVVPEPLTDDTSNSRIVENNPKFAINSNTNLSDPHFVRLTRSWGTVYSPSRVLCLIPTLWPVRKRRMDIIMKTWGKGCTKLMWVVDEKSNAPAAHAGAAFMRLPLSRHQNHTLHVRNKHLEMQHSR